MCDELDDDSRHILLKRNYSTSESSENIRNFEEQAIFVSKIDAYLIYPYQNFPSMVRMES